MMFGMNPAAWLHEHHREQNTLIAAAIAAHATPSSATVCAAPEPSCC